MTKRLNVLLGVALVVPMVALAGCGHNPTASADAEPGTVTAAAGDIPSDSTNPSSSDGSRDSITFAPGGSNADRTLPAKTRTDNGKPQNQSTSTDSSAGQTPDKDEVHRQMKTFVKQAQSVKAVDKFTVGQELYTYTVHMTDGGKNFRSTAQELTFERKVLRLDGKTYVHAAGNGLESLAFKEQDDIQGKVGERFAGKWVDLSHADTPQPLGKKLEAKVTKPKSVDFAAEVEKSTWGKMSMTKHEGKPVLRVELTSIRGAYLLLEPKAPFAPIRWYSPLESHSDEELQKLKELEIPVEYASVDYTHWNSAPPLEAPSSDKLMSLATYLKAAGGSLT